MRRNVAKERLEKGKHIYGMVAREFFTPGLPQIVNAAAGDFLMLEGADLATVRLQAALCRGLHVIPVACLPDGSPGAIGAVLEAGAFGVAVHLVESRRQAEQIVAATRFLPRGARRATTTAAHDDFRPGELAEDMQVAEKRTLVVCMIGSEEGVSNADQIAAVPGVDVLWLSHVDLANSLGVTGAFDDPHFVEAVDTVANAADLRGKAAGIVVSDDTSGTDYLAKGYRMLAYGVDAQLLQAVLRQGFAKLREDTATLIAHRH